MIIGIDASRYGHAQSTGVEWYSYHLLNELIPLFEKEQVQVRLYAPMDFQMPYGLPPYIQKKIIPFRRLWTMIRLSFELLIHPVDVFFVPSHIFPMIIPKKAVITIHDTAFEHFRHFYSQLQYFLMKRATKRAVRKAWKIIVPSKATQEDLIKFYRCDPKKIHIIPHGYSLPGTVTPEKRDIFLQKFQLSKSDFVIAFLGRIEEKKNLLRLLEAFHRFLYEFPNWKLILAGKKGVGFEKIFNMIQHLKLQNNVVLPGYISEGEKAFLLDESRIVAFPSLYEGFGLPVLEGFAYHRPVLTSCTSSLPEVAGKAAYLIHPEKVEEISVGLKRLASDGILVNQLIQKGHEQLKLFSWKKSAQKTLEALLK